MNIQNTESNLIFGDLLENAKDISRLNEKVTAGNMNQATKNYVAAAKTGNAIVTSTAKTTLDNVQRQAALDSAAEQKKGKDPISGEKTMREESDASVFAKKNLENKQAAMDRLNSQIQKDHQEDARKKDNLQKQIDAARARVNATNGGETTMEEELSLEEGLFSKKTPEEKAAAKKAKEEKKATKFEAKLAKCKESYLSEKNLGYKYSNIACDVCGIEAGQLPTEECKTLTRKLEAKVKSSPEFAEYKQKVNNAKDNWEVRTAYSEFADIMKDWAKEILREMRGKSSGGSINLGRFSMSFRESENEENEIEKGERTSKEEHLEQAEKENGIASAEKPSLQEGSFNSSEYLRKNSQFGGKTAVGAAISAFIGPIAFGIYCAVKGKGWSSTGSSRDRKTDALYSFAKNDQECKRIVREMDACVDSNGNVLPEKKNQLSKLKNELKYRIAEIRNEKEESIHNGEKAKLAEEEEFDIYGAILEAYDIADSEQAKITISARRFSKMLFNGTSGGALKYFIYGEVNDANRGELTVARKMKNDREVMAVIKKIESLLKKAASGDFTDDDYMQLKIQKGKFRQLFHKFKSESK